MKKRFVLPKKIPLPGGFTIRIEIAAMTDAHAEFEYNAEGASILRIAPGLTQKQQKYYLSHELIHAMVDYHHLFCQEGAEP